MLVPSIVKCPEEEAVTLAIHRPDGSAAGKNIRIREDSAALLHLPSHPITGWGYPIDFDLAVEW